MILHSYFIIIRDLIYFQIKCCGITLHKTNTIMNTRPCSIIKILCLLTLFSIKVSAQQESINSDNRIISYQGVLSNLNGAIINDGEYDLTISLYNSTDAIEPLWQETYTKSVHNGLFNIDLGAGRVPLPQSQVLEKIGWLGIRINDQQELRPRTRLGVSPKALSIPDNSVSTPKLQNASVTSDKLNVDYISSLSINGQKISKRGQSINLIAGSGLLLKYDNKSESIFLDVVNSNSGFIPQSVSNGFGTNTTNPCNTNSDGFNGYNTVVGGCNDSATALGGYASILGGLDNFATATFSTTTGGNANKSSGEYSTVSGGNTNTSQADYAAISGGDHNDANAKYSFIGSGFFNSITGDYCAISGGYINSTSALAAFIGGGANNIADGIGSVIGGGSHNTSYSLYSSIVGGYGNTIYDEYSFIGGGSSNRVLNKYATIAGGSGHYARGIHTTIGGGLHNDVDGNYSTISGGFGNTISPVPTLQVQSATIPGGEGLIAQSWGQFVTGTYNKANGSVQAGYSNTSGMPNNNRLVIIGNGRDDRSRSNAFEVTYDGHSIVYGVNQSGSVRTAKEGSTYVDNIVYAWGIVSVLQSGGGDPPPVGSTFSALMDFGVASVVYNGVGDYTINLSYADPDGNVKTYSTCPVVSLIDAPCGATIQTQMLNPAGTFRVLINTLAIQGPVLACIPTNAPFSFHVTGRP